MLLDMASPSSLAQRLALLGNHLGADAEFLIRPPHNLVTNAQTLALDNRLIAQAARHFAPCWLANSHRIA